MDLKTNFIFFAFFKDIAVLKQKIRFIHYETKNEIFI